jgi:hypothetical protein
MRLGWTPLLLFGLACSQEAPTSSQSSSKSSTSRSTAGGRSSSKASGFGSSPASSIGGGSTGGASSSMNAGSSSANGSSSSGGSSSVTEGVCITSEVTCPAIAICPTPVRCPTGTGFSSQVVDYIACTPIANAAVTAIDADGVPFPGVADTTQSDGSLSLCLPGGVPFSIQMDAAAYPTTYLAELLDADAGYFSQAASISTAELQAFASIFPGGVEPEMAFVLVKLKAATCGGAFPGWTIGVSLPDGGALPDGGYQLIYFGPSYVPDPTATVTTTKGAAAIYNLDPSISPFIVVTASNPDAGACQSINGSLGLTGRLYVSGGAVTVDPIVLP